ncbi:MAG: GIY-YIG nuclease family protein [Rickettsiales bacterium]|jgi:putative endonuclease|nr:GIY-YIG nuclease family protein [Rickettsiales bacterium]
MGLYEQKHGGYVYIMTNEKMGTLYIGVTANLEKRVNEHRTKKFTDSFTAKHDLKHSVYYETFGDIQAAIAREKHLKKWNRNWKLKLIVDMNPNWLDLYEEMLRGR